MQGVGDPLPFALPLAFQGEGVTVVVGVHHAEGPVVLVGRVDTEELPEGLGELEWEGEGVGEAVTPPLPLPHPEALGEGVRVGDCVADADAPGVKVLAVLGEGVDPPVPLD